MAKQTKIKLPSKSSLTHLDLYQYEKSNRVCIEMCRGKTSCGKLLTDASADEARAILQRMLDAIKPAKKLNWCIGNPHDGSVVKVGKASK